MCSVCCSAHITTIFDFVPSILRRRMFSLCNRCLHSVLQVPQGYKHRWNVNLIFHKAPQEHVERCQVWRLRRTGSGTPRPSHRSGNSPFKNIVTSLWMCGGVPPCWKTFALFSDSWDINHNSNVSRQIIPLTGFVRPPPSSKKNCAYTLSQLRT